MAHARSTFRPLIPDKPALFSTVGAMLGLLLSALCVACEATPDDAPSLSSDIILDSEDNYTSTLSLSIELVPIDPATGVISWAGIGDNLRRQPVTPSEITLVTLAQFAGQLEDDVTADLESGAGVTSTGHATFTPSGVTETTLSAFKDDSGNPLPSTFFNSPATDSYLLTFGKGMNAGEQTQAMVFLEPVSGAPVVEARTGSLQLTTFQPTFAAAVPVPVNKPPGVFGWDNVRRDSQMQPLGKISYANINRVLVAFVAGESIEYLANQDNFFQLETTTNATGTLWSLALQHPNDDPTRNVELSTLKNRDSVAFEQFTTEPGLWIFAAMCDTCNNPAVIMTELKPTAD